MEKGYSCLIINDMILADTNASMYAAASDFAMMALFGGRERTKSHWLDLLGSVGLIIQGIWTLESGADSVIEAVRED